MNLQEICDLIDENFYKENNYYLSINNPEEFAKQVALEFGKQCFEASRENKRIYNPEKDDKLEMITLIIEFKTFEDYLKSLENDS